MVKKMIVSAAIVAGFAVAALAPSYSVEIKITEKSAQACNNPGCGTY